LRKTEAETKLIFAANKIISMHINIKIMFFLFKKRPKQPIINTIKERIKKW
jgi:hypothetical protein